MRLECWERFPRHLLQRKPLVSDPDLHHSTCVTQVPWCRSGSLTRGGGENVPSNPGACATCKVLRIWQEPHGICYFFWNIPISAPGEWLIDNFQCPLVRICMQMATLQSCATKRQFTTFCLQFKHQKEIQPIVTWGKCSSISFRRRSWTSGFMARS